MRLVRQHEFERPDDMGRDSEQFFPLDQRLANKAELVIFEVTQAAMNQLGAGRGSVLGEIVLLQQPHGKPAPRRVAGDGSPIHAAPDDQQIGRRRP